jgi:PKD repeat protein
LYFYGGNPDLVNNTIVGNWTPDQYSPTWEREGGGLYVTTAHLTIVNSVFWDNSPQQLYVDEYTVLTVAYTDVEGGQAGVVTEGNPTINDAEGNIAADPRFVDAANGDYHLEANSPAVDAGTAYFEWEGRVLVDLAPGDYLGAAPDMGAYDVAGSGQVNQPPVAVASADPDHGSAPLTVQFSADGSSDPDGSIVAYAWDFGDGSTSSEADPAHTYMAVGTFQAMLTVTDDDGATGTDAVAVSVSQVSQNELHVQNQTVSRQTFLRYARGLDEVLVTDQNNQPVAGAVVTAVYSGPNKGTVTGMTGSDGTVLLATKIKRNPSGVWCFEVTDVAKDGYLYNPAANVVTIQCERQ